MKIMTSKKYRLGDDRDYELIKDAVSFHADTRGSYFWSPAPNANGRRTSEHRRNAEAVNATIRVIEVLKTKEKEHALEINQRYKESCRNVYVTSEFYWDGKKTNITRVKNILKCIPALPPAVHVISDLLEVRLERGKSNVYVAGKKVAFCKNLILQIPADEAGDYDGIDSIDDAAAVAVEKHHVHGDEGRSRRLLSRTDEFWGHCSNLQAWHEHGYDTRILHSNIAFTLLKALAMAGDEVASRVLAWDVKDRWDSGSEATRKAIRRSFHGYELDKFGISHVNESDLD